MGDLPFGVSQAYLRVHIIETVAHELTAHAHANHPEVFRSHLFDDALHELSKVGAARMCHLLGGQIAARVGALVGGPVKHDHRRADVQHVRQVRGLGRGGRPALLPSPHDDQHGAVRGSILGGLQLLEEPGWRQFVGLSHFQKFRIFPDRRLHADPGRNLPHGRRRTRGCRSAPAPHRPTGPPWKAGSSRRKSDTRPASRRRGQRTGAEIRLGAAWQ